MNLLIWVKYSISSENSLTPAKKLKKQKKFKQLICVRYVSDSNANLTMYY